MYGYDDPTRIDFSPSGATELPLIYQPRVLRCEAAGPGGDPLMVLLDTGTDPSAIDLGLAQRLGLPLGRFALGQGAASNAIPYTETVLPWLRLGDITLRSLYTLALDLSTMPFQVDIVLGYNVLWQVVFHIDYTRRLVRLSHPDLGMPQPAPGGALLPLTFFEHFPALTDIALCCAEWLPLTTLATIDTGSNGGVTLSPDLARQVGLWPHAERVTLAEGAGFGGRCEVLRGKAESLRLGPFTLPQVDVDTPGKASGDFARQGRVNLGNRLLERFGRIVLDYRRSRCVLEPPVTADFPME